MKLSERLNAVASFVSKDAYVLDVGCDHAFLSIYLLENKLCKKVIASDNKEGPTEQATKNIKQKKLDNKIKVKLGNGLETYEEGLDTAIIAGMGGKTIMGILKNDLKITKQIETFIIQPNNYQSDVRKCMIQLGFYIEDETLVKEKKYIYQVIKFKKGKKKYSKKELFFGPIILEKKGELFKEYLLREIKSREILLQILPKNFYMKKWKTKREIKIIKRVLENK